MASFCPRHCAGVLFSALAVLLASPPPAAAQPAPAPGPSQGPPRPVTLARNRTAVVLSNGVVTLTLSYPAGLLIGLSYGPYLQLFAELPDMANGNPFPSAPNTKTNSGGAVGPPGGAPTNRGYYDCHWNAPNSSVTYSDQFHATSYSVIEQSDQRVTVSFRRLWAGSRAAASELPLDVDLRFSLAQGEAGFYSYATLEHAARHPAAELGELRLVMKLRWESFNYAVLADDRQRYMPEYNDLANQNSQQLLFNEARQLMRPHNEGFDWEVDQKYNYMLDMREQLVYGWVTNDTTRVGLWLVNPYKHEYAPGGVLKQDLTLQVGPYLLNYLHSGHIGTPAVGLAAGQPWKKTYGPFFVYLNQAADADADLWEDAKAQAQVHEAVWPYAFATTDPAVDYPPVEERGTVNGQLVVQDPYLDTTAVDLSAAWLGLALPGAPGSWAQEVYGYQYWTQPVSAGPGPLLVAQFGLTAVRAGNYSLYAYIPGVFGDYKFGGLVSVAPGPGAIVQLGTLVFHPPRWGPTLWEVGTPDRTAAEFYVPVMNTRSPYPYTASSGARWRNYGAWWAFVRLYPPGGPDPVFEVGASDAARDWFYCHTNRLNADFSVNSTVTYTVLFRLREAPAGGAAYVLRLAVAGSQAAAVQVRVNTRSAAPAAVLLDTALCRCSGGDSDNGMARAAVHGQYSAYSVEVSGSALVLGTNAVYLTQRRADPGFVYVMYDYLRLEGPPPTG